MTHVVGSYPPNMEIQNYTTPAEDAPSGMMAPGSYTVHSLFTVDNKKKHLKWEWVFKIKKILEGQLIYREFQIIVIN